MYEICYDETGTRYGGRKFTDSDLIKGCLADVHALYDQGGNFQPFFERKVAPLPLPPPLPNQRSLHPLAREP